MEVILILKNIERITLRAKLASINCTQFGLFYRTMGIRQAQMSCFLDKGFRLRGGEQALRGSELPVHVLPHMAIQPVRPGQQPGMGASLDNPPPVQHEDRIEGVHAYQAVGDQQHAA
jgi:hypothetical protein